MKNEMLGFDDLSDDSTTEDSEDELIKEKQKELKQRFESRHKPLLEINSDISESETEEETCDFVEISIKNKIYLLEDSNVYVKRKNGTKGELYGTYSNGKVKRISSKDIVV